MRLLIRKNKTAESSMFLDVNYNVSFTQKSSMMLLPFIPAVILTKKVMIVIIAKYPYTFVGYKMFMFFMC